MKFNDPDTNLDPINWTYTQLIPDLGAFTLDSPTQFIHNHRRVGIEYKEELQINLDYLDFIEMASSEQGRIDDHIILGNIYAGELTLHKRLRKKIYLRNENDMKFLIIECAKRLPNNMRLIWEANSKTRVFAGVNSSVAAWHSATDNFKQYTRMNFLDLLRKMKYEESDFKALENSMQEHVKKEDVINYSYYRLINLEPGYYQINNYPLIEKLVKHMLLEKLSRMEKLEMAIDGSFGIYFVSDEHKLFKVMPNFENEGQPKN